MINKKIKSEFLAEINGTEFKNSEIYKKTLRVLEILETTGYNVDQKTAKETKKFFDSFNEEGNIALHEIEEMAVYGIYNRGKIFSAELMMDYSDFPFTGKEIEIIETFVKALNK